MNSESLSTHSRQEFCLALKARRERSGITLDRIAETTKIPASVFEALERNDLRRWPKGLFRRSFFRDYARTIGLPANEACAEFVRMFPDDESAELNSAAGAISETNEGTAARLALDPEWQGPRLSAIMRLLAALLDAVAVVLVAAGFAWIGGTGWPAATAFVALAYFSLATALLGESAAQWAIPRGRSALDALMTRLTAIAAPATIDEPERRPWVSDARRVGPSRLRVRIKLS